MADEVGEKLGRLIEGVDGLRRDFNRVEAENNRRHNAADVSRKALHEEVGILTANVGKLDTKAAHVEKELQGVQTTLDQEVMPAVRKVTAWENRARGGRWVVRGLWSAGGLAIAAIAAWVSGLGARVVAAIAALTG